MNTNLERRLASAPSAASRALAAALAALLGTLFSTPLLAQEKTDEAGGLITGGKAGVSFRYRLENVYQDDFATDATASTLRTRLNYRSGNWNGFGFFAEYDYVLIVGWDDYNAGAGNTPDKEPYPVVADPDGGDLNQAYIQWQSAGGTLIRGGRQRIIYDNARFVGNVGWRQNEQTYDGAYVQHQAGGFDWQAAWVGQVNRIFGNDVPAGEEDNSTWLLNGSKAFDGAGKLAGYYYDIENKDSAAASTTTWGLRYTADWAAGAAKLGLATEYAHQSDAHNNPVNYSASYYRFDLSAAFAHVTPYIGYESLGGDDSQPGAAFRTPLATLHAFNGWADKFLSTPNAGLNDLFVGLKGKAGDWSWDVLYHDFEAESGSGGYGDELDASLSRPMGENLGLLLKAAWFDGAPSSVYADTVKLWVQLTFDL